MSLPVSTQIYLLALVEQVGAAIAELHNSDPQPESEIDLCILRQAWQDLRDSIDREMVG